MITRGLPPSTYYMVVLSPSQGRYTWRHDNALKKLASDLRVHLQPGERLYADLPGMRVTDNPPTTIPVELLDTSARPDIVIVRASEIVLLELMVPYNSPNCLHNARIRKEGKELYLNSGQTTPYHSPWSFPREAEVPIQENKGVLPRRDP